MRTLSINAISTDYAARVLKTMQDNYGYIVCFNGARSKEAFQQMFFLAMRSENRKYSDMTPYLKVLARNVLKPHNRDIPYAPYDEDGEVSFIFSDLKTEDDLSVESEDRESINRVLQELYLRNPEDFMLLKEMIPCTDAVDVPVVIKNDELKNAIAKLTRDFGGRLVFYCICDFLAERIKEHAKMVNAEGERVVDLSLANKAYLGRLSDRKWICDEEGNPCGINPYTLTMENDFNPEMHVFRLAVRTSCNIWKVDCYDYFSMLEEKISVEPGVDNEYIRWCGSTYLLISPAGRKLMGVSREQYIDVVRQELILAILAENIGTVVALGPDTIYLKLTKAAGFAKLKLKTPSGRTYALPLSVQPTKFVRV